ncbi:hypothetical protein OBBRIDRAFT_803912 [Obba rivulosa]|uniref:Pentatricopeptide repeat domain-containing protein n=1 Tax=Obba rivulosa TaxID=1052685 RepID=A0A8E2DJL7_9APHY|nr:hypothetical protein OBBRIDRAFT_803912 [Obba rivulosa]
MASVSVGIVVCRKVHRPSSIVTTTPRVLARISSSGPISRYRGVRRSSAVTTTESQPPLAPDESSDHSTTILTDRGPVQTEWDAQNEQYLVLVKSNKHKPIGLRWSTSPIPSRGQRVLVSKTKLIKDAIPAFTSLIDAAFGAAPRDKSDAVRAVGLLHATDIPYALKVLLDERGMSHLSALLIEHDYPLHALHAAAVGFIQARHSPRHRIWQTLASRLLARRHWAWIPALVKLEVELMGQTTATSLNWLATACIETGVHQTAVQVLDMFREAKLRPNECTYKLLTKFQLLGPPLPSSSDVDVRLHHNGVDTDDAGVFATADAVNTFRSIIRNPSRIPSEGQVVNDIKIIAGHPKKTMLFRSVREHWQSLTKDMVTKGHPHLALHIAAISYRLTRHPDVFRRLYRPLQKHNFWDFIPDLMELELKLRGRSSRRGLNSLIRYFIESKIGKDPAEMRKIFERTGVQPNGQTRRLLEDLAAISSAGPVSPDEHSFGSFQRVDDATSTNDLRDNARLPSAPSIASALLASPVLPKDPPVRAVELPFQSPSKLLECLRTVVYQEPDSPEEYTRDSLERVDDSTSVNNPPDDVPLPSTPSRASAPLQDSAEPSAPLAAPPSSTDTLVRAVDLHLRSLRHLVQALKQRDTRWDWLAQELENVEAHPMHDKACAVPLGGSEARALPESSRTSAASGTGDSL